jgi:peptidyl-prolyl cis-trans isomerase C
MIEERVWMQMAMKNGVANRAPVKQQIEQQRRDLIIRTYLNDVMAQSPAVSDSEAKVNYDAHIADYRVPATITLRHILLKKESDAKNVLRQAKMPKAKWDDLVKRWSADSLTRGNGGSLGTVTKEGQFASIGAQPALAEAAFALKVAEVGGPYKTDRGWHVVKVDALKEESTRSFDQVKQMISRQLSSQRSQDYYKTKLDDARSSLGVKPDSAAIKGFVSQKKLPREIFNEAQTITSPQARLDAYEGLLRDYPDSDVSPQAQFMIGFINSEELKNYDAAEKAFRDLLRRYPQAELAASAQWMIDHMRSEDAPSFINLDSDTLALDATDPAAGGAASSKSTSKSGGSKGPKPWRPKPATGNP